MLPLYLATVFLLLLSLASSRQKTVKALRTGAMMFINLLPPMLSILMLVAVALTLLGPQTIQAWLGDNSGALAYVVAALTGAIALIPGFVAYPMAGMLVKNGVAYPVIAVFMTTLMMVGIVTLPLEKRFFGLKLALARNALNFVGALLIGLGMSLVWNLL
jgi:uncharacterized membrane protein YraQ (UPF0718 family)